MSQGHYERFVRALQLAGLSEETQTSYARAMRQLVTFCEKPPEALVEADLERYFHHRRIVEGRSPSTLGIARASTHFFFTYVLERRWKLFEYLSARGPRELPCILERSEVHRVLGHVKQFHHYACLIVIYACGLRISEARALRVQDIDGERGLVHVHLGKGAKDRYVPISADALQLLRRYWKTHRHPTLIFPRLRRGRGGDVTASTTMGRTGVQDAFAAAVAAAGITRRITPHTLRHCYATHLLEAGVNVRTLQRYLGHSRLESTMVYLHLTRAGSETACAVIEQTMRGFSFNDPR